MHAPPRRQASGGQLLGIVCPLGSDVWAGPGWAVKEGGLCCNPLLGLSTGSASSAMERMELGWEGVLREDTCPCRRPQATGLRCQRFLLCLPAAAWRGLMEGQGRMGLLPRRPIPWPVSPKTDPALLQQPQSRAARPCTWQLAGRHFLMPSNHVGSEIAQFYKPGVVNRSSIHFGQILSQPCFIVHPVLESVAHLSCLQPLLWPAGPTRNHVMRTKLKNN